MSILDPRDIVGPATLMNISSPNLAVDEGGPKYTFHSDTHLNSVSFICKGEEMLRCSPDGFYVRGTKVNQDDNEAQIVYNSFKEWLTWQQLNRG